MFFFLGGGWEGSTTTIDYRKKVGALILTSQIWRTKRQGLPANVRAAEGAALEWGLALRGHQPRELRGRPALGAFGLVGGGDAARGKGVRFLVGSVDKNRERRLLSVGLLEQIEGVFGLTWCSHLPRPSMFQRGHLCTRAQVI